MPETFTPWRVETTLAVTGADPLPIPDQREQSVRLQPHTVVIVDAYHATGTNRRVTVIGRRIRQDGTLGVYPSHHTWDESDVARFRLADAPDFVRRAANTVPRPTW